MSAENKFFVVSVEINQQCPFTCPFCYARKRLRGCRWTRERLSRLIEEAVELHGRTAIVYGDGEPLQTPELTGWAMRKAIERGAVQTGFTTSGSPRSNLVVVEETYGGPLEAPEASVTVSIDTYKVTTMLRCMPQSRKLRSAWTSVAQSLSAPTDPPESLCTIEEAAKRGWDVAVNLLVTRGVARLLPIIHALASEDLIVQVNLLAPKNAPWLLPRSSLAEARYIAYHLATWLGDHITLAVDSSMKQLLEDKPGCVAGELLLSIDACGTVRPCSFTPHGIKWTPGKLKEIAETIRKNAEKIRRGKCPYMVLE